MLELRELGSFGSGHDAIRGLEHVLSSLSSSLIGFSGCQYNGERLNIGICEIALVLGEGGNWTELARAESRDQKRTPTRKMG